MDARWEDAGRGLLVLCEGVVAVGSGPKWWNAERHSTPRGDAAVWALAEGERRAFEMRAAAGGAGRGSWPDCQSRRTCSRRPKMRSKSARIRACRDDSSQPPWGTAAVAARRLAIWSASGGGLSDIGWHIIRRRTG